MMPRKSSWGLVNHEVYKRITYLMFPDCSLSVPTLNAKVKPYLKLPKTKPPFSYFSYIHLILVFEELDNLFHQLFALSCVKD